MSFNIDLSGLEKFKKELNQKVQNFNSKPKTFADVFDSSFMNTYTKFSSIDDFFNNGGFSINSKEDLENINESDLDKYVSNNSTFSSWNEMQKTASVEYAKKQLF